MDSAVDVESDPDTAIALPQEENGIITQKSPLSPPDEALELRESESQAAHLDVRDSSTESDKTVLSITTAAAHDSKLPEAPQLNKLGVVGLPPLPVPRIVVEEFFDSSSLIDSTDELARVEQSPRVCKTTPTPLVRIPKAFSVPNASSAFEASNFEYKRLDENASSSSPPLARSAFSSRESLSLSLNATTRLTRSDCALDFKKDPEAEARKEKDDSKRSKGNDAGAADSGAVASRNGPKKKRLKKRSELNKSLVQLGEITNGSKDEITVDSLLPVSKSKLAKRRSKLRQQLKLQGGAKSAVQSSSSSESIHSHM